MNKYLVFLLLLIASVASAQKIPPRPSPPTLVNDFVGLLTQDQRNHLEQKLVAYDDSTSVQVAVVIVNTLDDYDPVDYAVKLGREWGVGNKKTNNGVIFLMSMEPGKRKVFIAPGYGLEGAIPDITAKSIIDNEVIPQFRQENYFRGIDNGVNAIIEASRGEYKAPEGYRNRGDGKGGGLIFIIILIVIFLILRRGGGGPRGGMMSRRGYRGVGALPFLFFPGGGGSGWHGGGGGGGGGGFGGFGGGSFGGGGAGGSW